MDIFENLIFEEIKKRLKEKDAVPCAKIIDIKPRTEFNDSYHIFDVLAIQGHYGDVALCVAYEVAFTKKGIDYISYNGSALYNAQNNTFYENNIAFGKYTREHSKRWLKSLEIKIYFSGGI